MVRYHQFAVSVHDTHSTSVLQLFETESEETVGKLIRRSPSKSCDLDPVPTSLLKTCLSFVLPATTNIVNSSIETGIVPQQLKKVHVAPILKNSKLDKNKLSNYRPVSNLPFISKVVEKVVAGQLNDYLTSNNLLELAQSAYRNHHSTETTLLCVQNDIL